MADCFKLISFLLFILFSLTSRGENFKFETLNVDQGLSNNTITCLLQDQQGFIWIGTEDGLNRYDGYEIREYRHDPDNSTSLGHNHISAIYQDPADSGKVLWIGTKGAGLNKFNLETELFTRYKHDPDNPTSLSDNHVNCIYIDSQGIYWIGTKNGGLNKFDHINGQFIFYQRDHHDPYSLSDNNVTTICEDLFGNLWIGTLWGGLNKLLSGDEVIDTSSTTSNSIETWTTHPLSEVWECQPQDSVTLNWKRKREMPTARWGSSACIINDKIYVVGGIGYSKPPDTPCLKDLEVYRPLEDRWDGLADMNFPRAGLSASVVYEKIYAIGGYATQYTWGSSGQVVEEYSSNTNTWTRKKDIPEKSGDHCAIVLHEKIYLLGGCSSDEFLDPAVNTVRVYNPATDSWSERANMNTARTMFATCIMDGKIYVMGGMMAPGSMAGLKSVEVYDPIRDRWKDLKEMPGARWGHTAAVIDGKIRVVGGLEKRLIQKSIFEYDTHLDEWRILPNTSLKGALFSSSQLNGKFYFIGGIGYSQKFNNTKSNSANNRRFIRYKKDVFDPLSLPSNHVYSIIKDQLGILWIGTGNGLRKFDSNSNKFTNAHFKNGFPARLNTTGIQSIQEDSRGNLWISTQQAELFKIYESRDQYVRFRYDGNTTSNSNIHHISSFTEDRSGIIWVGTKDNGIKKLVPERKKIQHFKSLSGSGNGSNSSRVSSIFNDTRSQLWIGSANGVLHKLDDKDQEFNQYFFDTNRSIEKICGTQNGELWLARGNALTKFNPETENFTNFYGAWGPYFTSYPLRLYTWIDDLHRKKRLIAKIDRVGNNQNIARTFHIEKKTQTVIAAQGEAVLNEVMDKAWLTEENRNKILWQMEAVNTRHAGGAARNRIQLDTLTLMPGSYQIHYSSNAEHAFDQWIEQVPVRPINWGISIFKLSSSMNLGIKPFLVKNNITTNIVDIVGLKELYVDQSGKLWALMSGRLYHFDENLKQFIHHEMNLDEKVITDIKLIYQDRSGTFWFGTSNNGLIRCLDSDSDISTQQELHYVQYRRIANDPNSLSNNNIYSIYEDQTGNIWVGTDRGLNKLNIETEIFSHFSEVNGLPSNLISGILDDKNGNLWIATPKGLSRFSPELEWFWNVDGGADLPTAGINDCFDKGPAGELYFGGSDGYIVFHPDSQSYNPKVPPVVITNLRIFNKSVQPGDKSSLYKSITHSREIKLKHNQDIFSFEFAALDYTNPAKNKYAHKMEGVDPNWVFTDASRRYVTYTSLEPGEYTFKLKASNNDGIWNTAGTSLKIIIAPPWWATRFAYLLYVLIIGSLVYGIWRFQNNRLKMQHKLELEHIHTAKLEELDRMKSKFFANISHEFRTPLTLILGSLDQMISGKLKRNVQVHYKLMRRNANRLLHLINQLLDLSKLEDGKLKLQAQKIEIISLLKGLVQAFESLTVLKNISLKFESELDSIDLYVDRDKFEKIMNNLLSNACKFTPEGGEVSVDFGLRNVELDDNSKISRQAVPPIGVIRIPKSKMVEIRISNTGPGIPSEHLVKIFDRFYQAGDWEYEGTGIGLTLTKELVELHHGRIQVESVSGRKTTFIINFPMGKEHLERDQIIEMQYVGKEPALPVVDPNLDSDTFMVDDKLPEKSKKTTDKLPLILIVEDHIDLRRYLTDILKNDAKIDEAVNGEDGFEKSTELVPDLIISDVMMPKIDGFELCKKLKTDERTSHIPVILMTARAAKEDKMEGLETGADDYIPKPFEADELLVRVKNLIEQRRLLRKRFSSIKGLRPEDIAVTSADERFLKRALEIIESHLSEPEFGVARFSQEMAMSRVQLHRKLQALTDQSASEFTRTIRLNRAAQLLGQNMDNISQIAYEVGFSNPSHFSTSFREQFGLSPKEYIKKQSSGN